MELFTTQPAKSTDDGKVIQVEQIRRDHDSHIHADAGGNTTADVCQQDDDHPQHYSANITAACAAASSSACRLYCTSKQEKLERRRMSNRRSALRRRVQEQAELESLEEQIHFLSHANQDLKSEARQLELLLEHAQKHIAFAERFIPKVIIEGDNKLMGDLIPTSYVTSASTFAQPETDTSFPLVNADDDAVFAQLRNSSSPYPVDPNIDVRQWGKLGKRKASRGDQRNVAPSVKMSVSGKDIMSPFARITEQNEVLHNGTRNVFPMRASDSSLQPAEVDAMFNSVLAQAQSSDGMLHFLQSKLPSRPAAVTTFDRHNVAVSADEDQVCSDPNICRQNLSNGTGVQFGQVERQSKYEEPLPHHEYLFQFDQKLEDRATVRRLQSESVMSDQSSSCSADLDRFLELEEHF